MDPVCSSLFHDNLRLTVSILATLILHVFQIIGRFDFSIYIIFAMDISKIASGDQIGQNDQGNLDQ